MPLMKGQTSQLGSTNPTAGGASVIGTLTTLTDLCRIGRNLSTDDAMGGQSDNWVQIAADVACRLYKPTMISETLRADEITSKTVFVLELPAGTDITDADQVDKGGYVYEVIDTDQGVTAAIYLTAKVVRVSSDKLTW